MNGSFDLLKVSDDKSGKTKGDQFPRAPFRSISRGIKLKRVKGKDFK